MINPGDREKREQERWQARFARGRLGLSAAVEEELANPSLHNDDFEDGDEDGEVPFVAKEARAREQPGALMMRPRLSLQSRPLPVVRVLPRPDQQEASTDAAPALPALQSTEGITPVQKKKRLAGRNTRVELRAIPKQEKKAGKKTVPLAQRTDGAQVVESVATLKEVVTEAPSAVRVRQRDNPAREKLAGAGKLLKGHAEVTVENSHVTSASVVLVSLLSNPGKIVVHYFTLLPGYGFTVHFSDEVVADTPFNYVILLGELL